MAGCWCFGVCTYLFWLGCRSCCAASRLSSRERSGSGRHPLQRSAGDERFDCRAAPPLFANLAPEQCQPCHLALVLSGHCGHGMCCIRHLDRSPSRATLQDSQRYLVDCTISLQVGCWLQLQLFMLRVEQSSPSRHRDSSHGSETDEGAPQFHPDKFNGCQRRRTHHIRHPYCNILHSNQLILTIPHSQMGMVHRIQRLRRSHLCRLRGWYAAAARCARIRSLSKCRAVGPMGYGNFRSACCLAHPPG